MNEAQAVVVTGVYGVGKTTVIEEMAEQLENAGLAFGAIDLDWLWWFNVPSLQDRAADGIGLSNLAAVAGNYRSAGVSRLMLAGAIADDTHLAELVRAIRCPLRVVRLTLPLREIENRLAGAVTTGRQVDLRQTREWIEEDFGSGIGDLVIANDRPVQAVAREILDWLGWV
ncbi:MAG TPA: hypothetical protein VJQ79_02630 [Acidimicrobiia bacterium]|nr:hypothetical protein [Acidimicrobiia bacterium]